MVSCRGAIVWMREGKKPVVDFGSDLIFLKNKEIPRQKPLLKESLPTEDYAKKMQFIMLSLTLGHVVVKPPNHTSCEEYCVLVTSRLFSPGKFMNLVPWSQVLPPDEQGESS